MSWCVQCSMRCYELYSGAQASLSISLSSLDSYGITDFCLRALKHRYLKIKIYLKRAPYMLCELDLAAKRKEIIVLLKLNSSPASL